MHILIEIDIDQGEDAYLKLQADGETLLPQRFSANEKVHKLLIKLLENLGIVV